LGARAALSVFAASFGGSLGEGAALVWGSFLGEEAIAVGVGPGFEAVFDQEAANCASIEAH
jgi:hypothetical protein